LTRVFGGILCLVLPSAILGNIVKNEGSSKDYVSALLIGSVYILIGFLTFNYYNVGFGGGLGRFSLLFIPVILGLGFFCSRIVSFIFDSALKQVKVKGKNIPTDLKSFFYCHLQVVPSWFFLIYLISLSHVLENIGLLVIGIIGFIRLLELEARIIGAVCRFNLKCSYIVFSIFFVVYGLIFSLMSLLIYFSVRALFF